MKGKTLISVVALGVASLILAERQQSYNHLVLDVAQRADINHDGMTSHDEWKSVYQIAGIYFDELHPQTLSSQELRKYLRFTGYKEH